MAELLALPANLESKATVQFDTLVKQGEILYEEARWERVQDGPLTLNFLVSPALSKKPILAKNDPARRKPKGPFVDPDPNFVLCHVGPDHTLILNKFCAVRPMFLLHTTEFQLQTDGLNESDFTAVWSLLMSFTSPQMVIYNCGADAGASQGHKHLQMFPAPDPSDCVMFPEKMQLDYERVQSDDNLPFHNFVIGLEKGSTVSQLLAQYKLLLLATKNALKLGEHDGLAYNVILVPGWMAMIPRTHANYEGRAPTNAAGMMGMIWVSGEAEVTEWVSLGLSKHLAYLGLPATAR